MAQTNQGIFDLETMLGDLGVLVGIESPSRDVEALTASAEALGALIERRLGGEVELIDSPVGPHVRWAGAEPKVLLLGHHDTVFPLGTLALRPFAVADGRATGPGVFDMAAGIVQAIHAVASLDDRSGCELLFSADEEIGSWESRDLIVERAEACGSVLVFEGSADGGKLKTARKGTGTFELVIEGRAAHAGLEPELGVNALVEAANQVLEIAGLGDADRGTTVTPTVASAGTATNVVPAEARVKVDVRLETADEQERIAEAMATLVPMLPGAGLRLLGGFNRPPMPPSVSTELFALAQRVSPGIEGTAVGGGSDGNLTGAAGVPTLDGLGAVGGGAHADHEYVVVDTMPERARLAAGLLGHLVT